MVARDEDERDENDTGEGESKGSNRGWVKWVVMVLGALILVGATAAVMLFVVGTNGGGDTPPASAQESADDATEAESEPQPEPEYEAPQGAEAIYFPIAPAFTVNFSKPSSSGKYLQVLMEVMSRDREVIEALKDNMPAIRNDLILLLGEQDPSQLRTAAGKQKLQGELLNAMRRSLARENRRLAKGVEAVYFTKFVIQ